MMTSRAAPLPGAFTPRPAKVATPFSSDTAEQLALSRSEHGSFRLPRKRPVQELSPTSLHSSLALCMYADTWTPLIGLQYSLAMFVQICTRICGCVPME